MKITTGVVLLIVAISAALGGVMRYRAVFETSHQSQLLWNEDQAFVFLVVGQSGRNSSYAYHLLSLISAFGAPTQNHRKTTTVFRITPRAVEQHQLDEAVPGLLIADGHIGTSVARWTGEKFGPFVARHIPEAFLMIGAERPADGIITRKDVFPHESFTDVEGWSKRTFMFLHAAGAKPVDFQLREGPARLVISGDANTETIDVERTGMPVTRLMTVNNRPRRVSLAEYNQIFRK